MLYTQTALTHSKTAGQSWGADLHRTNDTTKAVSALAKVRGLTHWVTATKNNQKRHLSLAQDDSQNITEGAHIS